MSEREPGPPENLTRPGSALRPEPVGTAAPQVEILSSRIRYEGPIFVVREESVRLPSGLRQDLAVVEHSGAVAIAARHEDGRMLLVRQYRHATGRWMLEVPAGRLEAGEDPLAAARRELEEETGHAAERWRELRSFWPAPGFCTERMTLFLAEGLSRLTAPRAADPDEELEVLSLRPAEVLVEAQDAKTLVAALLLASWGASSAGPHDERAPSPSA